jgi:hypothetical protein
LTPALVSAVHGDQANCAEPHDSDPSDVPSGAATASGGDKSTLGTQISTCVMSGLHAKYRDSDIINVIMNQNSTSGAKSFQDEVTAVSNKCGKQAVAGKLPTVKKSGHTTSSPKP